jgi:hypothetical protein
LPGAAGPGRVQVFGRWERVDGEGDRDTTTPAIGANYLVRGHDLKTTVEWSQIDRHDVGTMQVLTVQVQFGM